MDNFELSDDNRDFQEWANQPNTSEVPGAYTPENVAPQEEMSSPQSSPQGETFSPEESSAIMKVLQNLATKYTSDQELQNLVSQLMGGQPLEVSTPEATLPAAEPQSKPRYQLRGTTPGGKPRVRLSPMSASQMEILVKIADSIDATDPDAADIIDQYIEEYYQEEDETPNFPENASILKEEYV